MKNKKIYLLIGIGFLLLILAYFCIYLEYYQKEKEKILSEYETLSVTVIVDYGNGTGTVDTLEETLSNVNRAKPYTAFELLNKLFDIESVEYKWGTSISCINDVCEDESTGYYWFFWHNGNFSSVSTEKYYLKDNDIITMKYISSKDVGM